MLPRWLIGFRALALASAFAAAFVPIATYITDDKRDWLWIHIGVNIAAYIAVALTTIYTTISLTQQDHNKYRVPAYWANNVIMRTWYLGVSKTWHWHVAAAVGRLGLALAMMQHLSTTCGRGCENYSIFTPHLHEGVSLTYPRWEVWLIAIALLIIFALLETSLLSAFALMTRLVQFPFRRIDFGLRLLIVVLILGAMIEFDRSANHIVYQTQEGDERYFYRSEGKHWYHITFTWLDNGTMLAARVMRPKETYRCIQYTDETRTNCSLYMDRPLVFMAILEALAACATYILAIIASLQLAHYLHWRREQGMTDHALTEASIT